MNDWNFWMIMAISLLVYFILVLWLLYKLEQKRENRMEFQVTKALERYNAMVTDRITEEERKGDVK